jgi:hypothetical protein
MASLRWQTETDRSTTSNNIPFLSPVADHTPAAFFPFDPVLVADPAFAKPSSLEKASRFCHRWRNRRLDGSIFEIRIAPSPSPVAISPARAVGRGSEEAGACVTLSEAIPYHFPFLSLAHALSIPSCGKDDAEKPLSN